MLPFLGMWDIISIAWNNTKRTNERLQKTKLIANNKTVDLTH